MPKQLQIILIIIAMIVTIFILTKDTVNVPSNEAVRYKHVTSAEHICRQMYNTQLYDDDVRIKILLEADLGQEFATLFSSPSAWKLSCTEKIAMVFVMKDKTISLVQENDIVMGLLYEMEDVNFRNAYIKMLQKEAGAQ